MGIGDLHVRGLMQKHQVAKAEEDASFFEYRRQLAYKARWFGCTLVVAPRFFPSSKRCSRCGHVKGDLGLATRRFVCDRGGFIVDRDVNASYNLEWVAASWAETETACREAGGCRFVGPVPVDDAGTEHQSDVLAGKVLDNGKAKRIHIRPYTSMDSATPMFLGEGICINS